MKKLATLFFILALVLSHAMVAVVAYNYANLLWGGKYGGYSAPASTAFFLAVPFGIGIIVCITLAIVFGHKAKKSTQTDISM